MAVIEKKILPKFFELVKSREKKFEFRLADFKIKKGDTLVLREWAPRGGYTGRALRRTARYVAKFRLHSFKQEKELLKKGFYIIQI